MGRRVAPGCFLVSGLWSGSPGQELGGLTAWVPSLQVAPETGGRRALPLLCLPGDRPCAPSPRGLLPQTCSCCRVSSDRAPGWGGAGAPGGAVPHSRWPLSPPHPPVELRLLPVVLGCLPLVWGWHGAPQEVPGRAGAGASVGICSGNRRSAAFQSVSSASGRGSGRGRGLDAAPPACGAGRPRRCPEPSSQGTVGHLQGCPGASHRSRPGGGREARAAWPGVVWDRLREQ